MKIFETKCELFFKSNVPYNLNSRSDVGTEGILFKYDKSWYLIHQY